MYSEFKNKVVIVTGADSGIGRECAKLFASEGAKVVIADWSEAGGHESVSIIEQAGGAAFVKVNVTHDAMVKEMVDFAFDTFGGLDYAHNNAEID